MSELISDKYSYRSVAIKVLEYVLIFITAVYIGQSIATENYTVIILLVFMFICSFLFLKPFWLLTSIFISYAYFGYVDIVGELSFGNILLILSSLQIYMAYTLQKNKYRISSDVLIIASGLLLICFSYMLADLLFGINIRGIIIYSIGVLVVPLLAIITANSVSRIANNQEKILRIYVIIIALSSVVAILQAVGVESMWSLRMALQKPTDIVVLNQLENKTRISGLSYYVVQLTYQLVSIFPFALGMYIYANQGSLLRYFYGLSVALIITAVILSQSVSAVIAILASMAVIYFFLYKHIKLKRIFMILILFIVIFNLSGIGKRFITPETTTLGRIPLALYSLYAIIENPWGYSSHSPEINILPNFISSFEGAELIGEVAAHNSFLNVGLSAGVFGLVIAFLIYFYLIRVSYRRFKKADNHFAKCLYASSIAFFIGYFFHSSVHNAGLFNNDVIPWLIMGVLFTNVQRNNEVPKANSSPLNLRM